MSDNPPDEQIIPYFEYLTDVPQQWLEELARNLSSQTAHPMNPMNAKKDLANQITAAFHGKQAADAAKENFERVVQGRDLPKDMPGFALVHLEEGNPAYTGVRRLDQLMVSAGLASSNGEAKRLINQRAVELIHTSGEVSTLSHDSLEKDILLPGDVIKVGKRRYLRLI